MNKVNAVCVIDDDLIYHFLVKKIIASNNVCNEILVFKNGEEAIEGFTEIIKSGNPLPEIILLDINMPFINGWEFIEGIKDILPSEKIPQIYLVSSSIDPSDKLKAEAIPEIIDFIVKPMTNEKILKIFDEGKFDKKSA